MPASANGSSLEAAQAFVRHYFYILNYAIATGQTGPLNKLGSSRCQSCNAIEGNIERVYKGGGSIDSDGWRLTSVDGSFAGPDHTFAIDLRVTLTREEIVRSPGAKPEVHTQAKQDMRATVHWEPSGWVMQELELVTQ